MSSIRDQIRDLAARDFQVPKESLRTDAPFDTLKVDSLAIVEFVFTVQEHFAVEFDTAEFDGLRSLDDLIAAVERKKKSGT